MGNIIAFMFGASGRFRRIDYWMHALAAAVIWVVVGYFSMSHLEPMAESMRAAGPGQQKIPPEFWSSLGGFFVFALVMFWIGMVNIVKRFHDFGKSGWNTFWFLVPFVNLWFAIKLGFFRGDEGDNAYGPSPYKPQPPKPPKPPRDQAL